MFIFYENFPLWEKVELKKKKKKYHETFQISIACPPADVFLFKSPLCHLECVISKFSFSFSF